MFTDPCRKANCYYHSVCVSKKDRTAECICPLCNDDGVSHTPVCGDNGKTYASKCHLQRESCKRKKVLKVVKSEPCGKNY